LHSKVCAGCTRNAVCNLGIESNLTEALSELGYHLEDIYEEERDPALGNGGLGRLAGVCSTAHQLNSC
jgi:starch phosphorylase